MHPDVEVVTAGTDWAAIVAAIVTGAAAVAGITGTAWQARRAREASSTDLRTSIEAAAENTRLAAVAESRRAELADRRRAYAACQAAFTAVIHAVQFHSPLLADAQSQMLQAVGELRLVAPPQIAVSADDLRLRISGYARVESRTESTMTDFDHLQDVLYELMRADLGVRGEPDEEI